MAMDTHISRLQNLCFICGQICIEEKKSLVEEYQHEIQKVFFLKEDFFTEHMPPFFCPLCHSKLHNLQRSCSTSKINLPDWKPHQDKNCFACQVRAPTQRKVGRTPKKPKGKKGRRSLESTPIWTRGDADQILSDTEKLDLSKDLRLALNGRVEEFFLCSFCNEIMEVPISNSKCRHSFCQFCLFPKLIGFSITDSICPCCDTILKPGDVHVSKSIIFIGYLIFD